jgi:hypothetical protein
VVQQNEGDREADEATDEREVRRAEHARARRREEVAREHARTVLHLMSLAP